MEMNSTHLGWMVTEKYVDNLIERLHTTSEDSLRTMNSEMIGLVLYAGRIGDMSYVERLLEQIDVTKVNPMSVASLLRSSLRFTPYLKHWFTLRDRLLAELPNHPEIKARALMVGMIVLDATYSPPTELDDLMRIHSNFRKK